MSVCALIVVETLSLGGTFKTEHSASFRASPAIGKCALADPGAPVRWDCSPRYHPGRDSMIRIARE
jgi:hypothetical protein